MNARVLLFATAACILTGVTFGLMPAVRATRVDLAAALKEGSGRTHTTRVLAGKTLVVVQISLSVLVIAAAALLVRSLRNLRTLDAGFERDNVLLFNVKIDQSLTDQQRVAFCDALLERLHGLPGVNWAAYSLRSPIDFSEQRRRIDIPGLAELPSDGVSTNVVTPEYFQAFGIQLKRGRSISAQDRAGSTAVALVSESMVRAYFGGADPLGRTIILGGEQTLLSIVGVVTDVRHERLREDPPPMVYTPLAQSSETFGDGVAYPELTVILRARGTPRSLAASARRLANVLSKQTTVSYVRTMDEQLDAALIRERVLASLSSAFGLLALLLAFVGLYGLMSYSVAQRAREIAVRVALGATTGIVLWRVLRESLLLAILGIGIGLAAALLTSTLVATFLFDLSPRDPLTLLGVALMLFMVACAAGFLPARQASRVSSIQVLSS
jgi:predicted permease